jgi:hypothetical protein
VRQALYALLQLAGFRDYRSRENGEPAEMRPTSGNSSNDVQPGAEFPRAVPPEAQRASASGPASGHAKPMQATRSDKN